MRILVINPNTTPSMTEKIGAVAKDVVRQPCEVVAVNPQEGPESIEGYYDEAMSVPGVLALVDQHRDVDGIVIACFDDSGLDAVRCMTTAPVVGIGEGAFHAASLLANKFAVVTTLSRSVPAIEHNLVRYGLATRCSAVRATDIPVLDLDQDPERSRALISSEIARAVDQDRAEAIVLGCAGMADLAQSLSTEHGLPVLDGVACASTLCQGLAHLGLKTSKLGGYAAPIAKRYGSKQAGSAHGQTPCRPHGQKA